jgi:hypothetical protein
VTSQVLEKRADSVSDTLPEKDPKKDLTAPSTQSMLQKKGYSQDQGWLLCVGWQRGEDMCIMLLVLGQEGWGRSWYPSGGQTRSEAPEVHRAVVNGGGPPRLRAGSRPWCASVWYYAANRGGLRDHGNSPDHCDIVKRTGSKDLGRGVYGDNSI